MTLLEALTLLNFLGLVALVTSLVVMTNDLRNDSEEGYRMLSNELQHEREARWRLAERQGELANMVAKLERGSK